MQFIENEREFFFLHVCTRSMIEYQTCVATAYKLISNLLLFFSLNEQLINKGNKSFSRRLNPKFVHQTTALLSLHSLLSLDVHIHQEY